jgi:hypothetical protein
MTAGATENDLQLPNIRQTEDADQASCGFGAHLARGTRLTSGTLEPGGNCTEI